jgi:hypothetical protein
MYMAGGVVGEFDDAVLFAVGIGFVDEFGDGVGHGFPTGSMELRHDEHAAGVGFGGHGWENGLDRRLDPKP